MFKKLRNIYNASNTNLAVHCDVHSVTFDRDAEKLYRYLIKNRSAINMRDQKQRTPLHIACAVGHEDKVHVLTALHADLNLPDRWGLSPLMTAVQRGHENCVKILVENRANINMPDANGDTALHQAIIFSNRSMAALLLDAGADIGAQNRHGHSPLFTSVCKNNMEMTKFLIEKRADIDMTDAKGKTPLMLAAENGLSDMVKVLLECGACKTKQDEIGRSAEDFALNNSHQVCADLTADASELESENKNPKSCNIGRIRWIEEYDFSDSESESSMMEKVHSRIDETAKKKVSFSPINAICEFDRDEPPAAVSKSHELNSDQEREEQLIQEASGLKGPEELGLTMQPRHQDSSLATQKKSVSGLLQEKCNCEKILQQREEQNKELLREAAELKEKVLELEEAKRELDNEALSWIEEVKSKDALAMQVNKLSSDLVAQKKLLSEGEVQQKAIKENLALSQSKCEELQKQLQEATRKCDCDKTIQQVEERNDELLREARDLRDQVIRLKEEKCKGDINTLKWEEELKQKEALVLQVKELRSSLADQKKSVSGLLQEKYNIEKILQQTEEQNKELLREATELKEKVVELEEAKRELDNETLKWKEELKNKEVAAMQVYKLSSDLVAQKKLLSEGEVQQKAIKENLALSQSKCEELQKQLQEATRKCDCDKTIQQVEEQNDELLRKARDLRDQVIRLKEEKRKGDIDTLKWEEELKQKEALVLQVKELRSSLADQKKSVSEVEERSTDLVTEATELKNQVIRLDEVENDREDSLRQLQQELANTQYDLELKKGFCKKLEQDYVSLLMNMEQLNRELAERRNLSQSLKTYVEEQEKVVAVQKLQKSDQEEIVQSLNSELARQNKTIERQTLKIAGLEKQVWESDVLRGGIGELKRENVRLLRCVDLKERKRGIATQKLQEALSASVVSAAAIRSLEEAIQKFAIAIALKEATIDRQSSKIAALQKQVQESVGFKAAEEESKKETVRLLRCATDREKAHAQRLQDVLSTSSATIERQEKELHKLMFDTVQQQTTIKCQSFQIEGLNKLAREAVRVKRELEESKKEIVRLRRCVEENEKAHQQRPLEESDTDTDLDTDINTDTDINAYADLDTDSETSCKQE